MFVRIMEEGDLLHAILFATLPGDAKYIAEHEDSLPWILKGQAKRIKDDKIYCVIRPSLTLEERIEPLHIYCLL